MPRYYSLIFKVWAGDGADAARVRQLDADAAAAMARDADTMQAALTASEQHRVKIDKSRSKGDATLTEEVPK